MEPTGIGTGRNWKFVCSSTYETCKLNSTVGVTSILGGASDNTGSGIARRLVLKTGLNIILACNIPKNSPMLEADAEKLLVQKLIKSPKDSSHSRGFLILLDMRNVY